MAIVINSINDNYFELNGDDYIKIYQPLKSGLNNVGLYNVYDTRQQLITPVNFSEFTINGNTYASQADVITALLPVVYKPFVNGNSVTVDWGAIGGTITNQGDLIALLNTKANENDLGLVAFNNDYNSLDNLPAIPENTSDLINDSGFITSGDTLNGTISDNQIAIGSLTANTIEGSSLFTFDSSTSTLEIGGDGSADDKATISVNGSNYITIKNSDDSITFSGDVIANSFVKDGATSDDVLLGDGSTTSLAGILPKEEQITGTKITGSAAGSTNLDWDKYKLFEIELTGATTLIDVSLPSGDDTKVIEMVVNGDFALTTPAYWQPHPNNDDYDGTVRNHLLVSCINGNTSSEDVIYSLSNLST